MKRHIDPVESASGGHARRKRGLNHVQAKEGVCTRR